MNLQDYVGAVLPPAGEYFILRGRGKLRSQRLPTTDAVLQSILAAKAGGDNVYIAAGSYDGRRSQQRCLEKTVLYVDIDYGTEAHDHPQYPTRATAVAAMKAAYANGLPRPSWTISSGWGFHLYWKLEVAVPVQAWQVLADILASACEITGLNVDGGITTDAARILRVPFTDNFKVPNQTVPCAIALDNGPVYTEASLADALNPFLTRPTLVPSSATDGLPAIGPAITDSDLDAGLPTGRVAHAAQIIGQCPIFTHAANTRGADYAGIIWHKILHVLVFCEDGAEFAHPLSDAHPTYKAGNTDWRFAESIKAKANGIGPTRCDSFAKHTPECQTCPHRGKVKSPIVLGMSAPSELPFPFRNGAKGLERYAGEDEGWERAARYQVHNLQAAVDRGNTTYLTVEIGGEQVSTDIKQFVDTRAVFNVLSQYSVPMDITEIQQIQRLIVAWIDQIREAGDLQTMVRSYGWVDGGFHYNGLIYTPDGQELPTAKLDSALAEIYRSEGSLEAWTPRADRILADHDRKASWVVIATAFAAPLVAATGAAGAMVSIVSPESGTGKTTAMRVAQSVWSHPRSGMNSFDDTANALVHKLGVLNSLSLQWDEVRQKQDARQFIQLLFRLAQGREKQRLTSNITQRATGEWSTLLCVASNESMLDHIDRETGNSDAGSARVLEVRAYPLKKDGMSDAEARHFFNDLNENYGVAGAAYAKLLAANKEAIFDGVRAVEHALSVKYAATGGQRFWTATIASMIVAATLATNHGICHFDIPAFKGYLEQRLIAMTARSTGHESPKLLTPPDIIRQFLLEHTEYVVKAQFLPSRGKRKHEVVIDSVRLPAVARVATSMGVVRMSRQVLEDWYYNSERLGGNITGFIEDLGKYTQVEFTRGGIDSGTVSGLGGRHRCVDIRLAGPFVGLIELPEVADNSDLT